MPKISILVPVYNVENYLSKCIDSILNQTFQDLEILCMDDGSTDTSGIILDQYAMKDSRVRVIHKTNSGYGDTMNQAVLLARGKYIGIVESDDYIANDMYEVLYWSMEKECLDFVKTDFFKLWDCTDGTEQVLYKQLMNKIGFYNKVMEPNQKKETYFFEKFTWNGLYRKQFLWDNHIQYNPTPGASYQDNGFWFQTMYHAKRILYLDKAFYYYRQNNPDSSINSNSKVFAMKQEYDFIHNFLEMHREKNMDFYKICFFHRIKGYFFTLSMLSDDKKLALADTLRKECRLYNINNEVDFQMFSEWEQKYIEEICRSPQDYVKKQIQQNQEICKCIAHFKQIIIYGAGNYGKSLYSILRKNAKKDVVIEFAVSKLKESDLKYYLGSKISEIETFSSKKDKVLIILAVKRGTRRFEEMYEKLMEIQFSNICFYDDIIKTYR